MSQYITVDEIGKRLLLLYDKFLLNPDLPILDFSKQLPLPEEHEILREMQRRELIRFDEELGERPKCHVYFTEKGKRHGSALKKYLEDMPKLE